MLNASCCIVRHVGSDANELCLQCVLFCLYDAQCAVEDVLLELGCLYTLYSQYGLHAFIMFHTGATVVPRRPLSPTGSVCQRWVVHSTACAALVEREAARGAIAYSLGEGGAEPSDPHTHIWLR